MQLSGGARFEIDARLAPAIRAALARRISATRARDRWKIEKSSSSKILPAPAFWMVRTLMNTLATTEYLPVAYLPGASGQATVWEPIAHVLAHRREALLFTYPGLGEAPAHEAIRSLPDLVRWVASELPERCDVVALSMGSTVALRLALEYPERIRRLVLVAPCGGVNAARFGALDWREAFVATRPFAPRWLVTDNSDFSEQLSQISAPTLLVLGEDDAIAPPAIGEFLLARLANAKLEVVSDATHDLEQEHPAFLASLIEAHLRR